MLKISKLTDYATAIVLFLHNDYKLYSSESIAQAVRLEIPTVSKILKLLTKATILNSIRGVNGGYQLIDKDTEISLYEVIAAIEGDTAITECNQTSSDCSQEQTCDTRNGWNQVNNDIKHILTTMTIKRMAELNTTAQYDVNIRVKDYV